MVNPTERGSVPGDFQGKGPKKTKMGIKSALVGLFSRAKPKPPKSAKKINAKVIPTISSEKTEKRAQSPIEQLGKDLRKFLSTESPGTRVALDNSYQKNGYDGVKEFINENINHLEKLGWKLDEKLYKQAMDDTPSRSAPKPPVE